MNIGTLVEILPPLRAGQAELIAIIPAHEIPNPRNILLWYSGPTPGHPIPKSAYTALRVNRYVFSRGEDNPGEKTIRGLSLFLSPQCLDVFVFVESRPRND